MKTQKKWIKSMLSIIMAGIMLFGMTLTTLAAGELETRAAETGTVTINNTVAGKGLTYYQIFAATKNGTAVAYTLNQEFAGFFTSNEKYGCAGLEGEAFSQKAYEYVSNQTAPDARKALSQELLAWTLANNKNGTTTTTTETTTMVPGLVYGFYLFNFARATNVDGITGDVATPAMLINVTDPAVTINMKSSYPVVDKTADDQSTAIGDTVTYTLTSHVPDMTGYDSYVFKFKDTLSAGLTFGKITEVKVGDQPLTAETQYTLTQEVENPNAITIEILNFINYKNQVGQPIVVKYTATVNEKAVVGMNPNTNEAKVEYSNDPSNPTTGVPSVPDVVDVHTFDFTVNKYFMADQQKSPLSGVGFRLYTDKDCMNEVKVVQESAGDGQNAAVYRKAKAEESGVEAITPAFGKIQFKGLDAGTYYLKETTTPDGYNKLTGPIKIEITPTYEKEKLTKYEVKYTYNDKVVVVSSDKKDQSPTIEVENKSGTELPNTGGIGAVIFTIAGVAILAVVMICSMRSKKRKHS